MGENPQGVARAIGRTDHRSYITRIPAQLLHQPVLPDSEDLDQEDCAATGDSEKMVIEVYNHIIMEKEDADGAVNDAMNF